MFVKHTLILLAGIWPLWAATPSPPFNQCPPVGADTSCAVLIVFNPDGSPTMLTDPSQGPYDQIEDTLVGIQNNSNRPIYSISINSSTDIFGFDGDGICGINPNTGQPFNPAPQGCPLGPTTYEGVVNGQTAGSVTFTVISTSSGMVNFPNGIPANGSAYFSLEEANFTINICGLGTAPVVEQIIGANISCPPTGQKSAVWGQFGSLTALVADSGETLTLTCDGPAGFLPSFHLNYTPAGSPTSFIIGTCPFVGGCNTGFFSHSGKDQVTGRPGCFIMTNWTSRDYGANDVPNPWTNAGGVNTVPDEPVLDWAISVFNPVTNNLSKSDQEFKYAVGPPVPGSLCFNHTAEGAPVKTINLADPPLGPGTQAFFNLVESDLQLIPPGGPMKLSNRSLADLNGDGKVDMTDFSIFQKALGSCVGGPNYNPAADYDADGCVTFKDYQIWYQFFQSANGGTKR